MGGEILRRLIAWAGYLLYTLVVLIGLLWFLFPADAVKGWLEQQLNTQYPNYAWSIDSLGIVFPGSLVLTKIGVVSALDKNTPLIIDRLSLTPDVPDLLLQKKKALTYDLELLEGSILGQVVLTDGKQFESMGTFVDLHLKQLEMLQQSLQRTIDGVLTGKFSSKGAWNFFQDVEVKGDLVLAGGTMQFKAPILGLSELPYTAIETDFRFHQGQWYFEQGTLQSTWMNGTFSGSMPVGISLAASRLELKGILAPRSEMFANVKNKQMAKVVRAHLKGGGLPFTVNGTAGEPGILFTGSLSQALKSLPRSTK